MYHHHVAVDGNILLRVLRQLVVEVVANLRLH
jgi:hypothetical protein